jgi:hypothetical protein
MDDGRTILFQSRRDVVFCGQKSCKCLRIGYSGHIQPAEFAPLDKPPFGAAFWFSVLSCCHDKMHHRLY